MNEGLKKRGGSFGVGVKNIFLFLGIIFIFFLKAGFVLALEIHYPTINFAGQNFSFNDTDSFDKYVCYLFGLLTNLAIFIAVIVIAFGGVYYLVSYGRGKFTSEAKDWIKAGVLGLLIVVSAFLIAYTINPELTTCKPWFLAFININAGSSSPVPLGVDIKTYKEIPIGILTENLLTRTMACYGFDQSGNPVDGNQITTDDNKRIAGPTYLDHDRADCITQLIDGAQKKAQVIAGLSDEITKLMNTCSCRVKDINGNDTGTSKCDDTCGGQAGCNAPLFCAGVGDSNSPCGPTSGGIFNPCVLGTCPLGQTCYNDGISRMCVGEPKDCPAGERCNTDTNMCEGSGSCTGSCVGAACQQPPGTEDCCPDGVKDQIEHGSISVTIDIGGGAIGGGAIGGGAIGGGAIGGGAIGGGAIGGGAIGGGAIGGCKSQAVEYKGLDEFRCGLYLKDSNPYAVFIQCSGIVNLVEKQIRLNNKIIDIIDQKKWGQLNLLQQLTYFKEKIEEIKQKIQADKYVLDRAKTTLGSCYLAIPYIDLLKTYESTNQQNRIISTQKIFSDPETYSPIDVAKYCQGFNYNNSSCLKKCNDMCPDTSGQAIQLYQQKSNSCAQNDKNCLEKAIEDAYNERPCIYGNTSQKFEDCISFCQGDCSNICEKKYLPCSDEYNFCNTLCENNGQCILDNAGECLFGAQKFKDCTNQITDQGNIKYCINNAYSCKNGSDEYAGYRDCDTLSAGTAVCQVGNDKKSCDQIAGCTWYGTKCSPSYSASYFYDNPNNQKCPKPYDPPRAGTFCYSGKADPNTSCQDLCPETTKCPASSDCPNCPCDQINQPLVFSIPDVRSSTKGEENYSPLKKTILDHEMVGPQCNEFSYNDDPLTFYCEDNWWNNPNKEGTIPTPKGEDYIIKYDEGGEVPVGQTVDDAENWADGLIKSVDKINREDIPRIINQMTIIGAAIFAPNAIDPGPIQDYCRCNAKFWSGDPICKTACQYSQQWVPEYDNYGNHIGWRLVCSCTFEPCKGSPCIQLIYYLMVVWNDYRQLKLDFVDFYTAMLKEPRSDIMKKLTYSRQTTNNCGLVNSAYGTKARMLNCTRVMDELISPINTSQMTVDGQAQPFKGYCYGIQLGKDETPSLSLMDNWFCCQEWSKNSTINKNPIYNIQK